MIQIFADGALVYDSRVEEYALQGLTITEGLNKGGTAEIKLPPYHPAYSRFIGYRTVVEIYRDGLLRFRGRALYPVNDYDNFRTVLCEGELCFLLDGISRPYLYQDNPENIFRAVVAEYNAQVDTFKQFIVGEVTVTDPNGYIRLESEEAETVMATVNKLTERCGGYIIFTTDASGARVINWLDSVGNQSSQVIEDGENLFDFSSSEANTDLATVLVPYGAKDETTGKRLTIANVNGGKDYIVDETSSTLYGLIVKAAVWDDVTDANNLLAKARNHLNDRRLIVTSLTLTALDLSYVDKTAESFKLGDHIRVRSKAHSVDNTFQLVERTEDLLNPANSYIHLGKEVRTLTSLDVAGDNKSQSELHKAVVTIKQDFDINVQQSIDKALESDATAEKINSIIKQQAGNITLEVSGSLGSKAQISMLVAGGQPQTAELDLTAIRQAFATDTSSVAISGGTITFNSNTLIVNSTNLQVSADGTITATNAVLSGTATTENGLYKSELSAGRLRFFYDGVEYGGIASGYMDGDTNTRGVTVRLSAEAKYVGFSRYNTETELNDLYYYINFGANIGGRTERHIFFGTSYFAEQMTVNGSVVINSSLSTKGHINLNGAYSVKCKTSQGEYINGLGLSANDQLVVGEMSHNLFLYGANVYIGGNGSGLVQIQGASAQATSPFTFYDTAAFNGAVTYAQLATFNGAVKYNGNAFFANEKGVALYRTDGKTVFAMTISNTNTVYVGSQDAPMVVFGSTTQLGGSSYPTTITGSTVSITGSTVSILNSVSIRGVVTFNNGYGVCIADSSGTTQYVLSLNNYNQVNVGCSNCPLYLRGTGVTINTGGLALADGSVILSNGYGVVIKDGYGVSQYVISLTSGNMVNVGSMSYVTYLRGTAVYLASSGATVTSDERKKNSIEELPEAYEALLDKLTPVRYKYNDGTSGRYHAGFIAQDVKTALEAAGLTTKDFGGFVDLNGDGEELGLIYSEFIALLLKKIKRQEQRIAALEEAKI